jgi:hypothetical protein
MIVLAAGIGFLLWDIATYASLFLLVISWLLIVANKKLSYWTKVSWIVATLILPVLGPMLYFLYLLSQPNSAKAKV